MFVRIQEIIVQQETPNCLHHFTLAVREHSRCGTAFEGLDIEVLDGIRELEIPK